MRLPSGMWKKHYERWTDLSGGPRREGGGTSRYHLAVELEQGRRGGGTPRLQGDAEASVEISCMLSSEVTPQG